MPKKRITIVVPCYNCENYISETFDFFEKQTFKDFVVLCINDGSTDKTLSLLQHWKEKKVFELKIIDKKNEGVSSARNLGILTCDTEFLVFCDSDDLFAPRFLEKLIAGISKCNSDASYCLLTKNIKAFIHSQQSQINSHLNETQNETMSRMLNNMGQISFDCILYRTEILKSNSILFDYNTRFGEDREFMWKYLCHCKNIAYVPEVLYFYRQNPLSATKTFSDWRRTDVLKAMQRVENYMLLQQCQFLPSFSKYMFSRCVWSVAKDFARSGNKVLFRRLLTEYDVKSNMKITKKDKNFFVRLSSFFFLLNPSLFYYSIKLSRL